MQKKLFKGSKEQLINLQHTIGYSDNSMPKLVDFTSWHEAHFEIVSAISNEMSKLEPAGLVEEKLRAQGHGGLYELAEEVTDKFVSEHEGVEWDGEFFDTMEKFIRRELY